MFWAKGDSSKLGPEDRQLLDGLRKLEETGHIAGTNPDQTKDALAAIRFFGMLTAATGLLAGFRNVSLWISGMLIGYWAFRDAAIAALKQLVNG